MVAKDKTRIFVECTQTFLKGGNSGIQRVVRNLANNGRELTNVEVEVYPLVWMKFGFCQPTRKISAKSHWLVKLKDRIARLNKRIATFCAPRFLKRAIRYLVEQFRLRRRQRIFREPPFLLKVLLFFPFRVLVGNPVTFRYGDIVVLVDSTWKSPLMLEALFEARCNPGIVVGAMIHDLFPLLMPEHCEDVTVEGFNAWFKRVVPMMDFFVANSESTRQLLLEYLDKHPELRSQATISGSFRLGAELDLVTEKNNPRHLQAIWGMPGRVILAVGTIEPRKNLTYLLDAYDILRAKDIDVSLVIVGRLGWKNLAVVKRLTTHPDFETRLLHLANASDRDLAESIERADCLVCPSIAEGFGLPVVEGLMRGLTIFASDIPVFHESGDGFCRFFDLDSSASLAGLLEKRYDELSFSVTSPTSNLFVWPDWKESTGEFTALVLNLAESAGKVWRDHHRDSRVSRSR